MEIPILKKKTIIDNRPVGHTSIGCTCSRFAKRPFEVSNNLTCWWVFDVGVVAISFD